MLSSIISLLFWAVPVQQVESSTAEELAAIVRAWHTAGEFDGVALVASKGEPLLALALGPADREQETLLDVDACFPIASLTKQFTAVLVLQAVERGELKLADTLGDVFPRVASERARRTQVQHLLLHAGGFSDPPREHYVDPVRSRTTDLEIANEFLLALEPDFEPGTEFRYSNADYHWLGAVLEARTGLSYPALLDERVVRPLALASTGIAYRDKEHPRRPRDYVHEEGEGWVQQTEYLWSNWQAAGGLESTLADLHRWNQALVRHELLSPAMTARMLTVPELPGSHVALGCWSYPRRLPGTEVTLRLAERRGAIGGFAVLNAFEPDREEWVILLSNHGNRTLDTLSYAPCLPLDLFSALHGGEVSRPAPR